MISNLVLASIVLSCITGALSLTEIKHTYHDKVHYFETGIRNYAFVGIAKSGENFKGIAVNNDQFIVERDGCDKRKEACVDSWREYLKTMVPSYSKLPIVFSTRDESNILHSLGTTGEVTGVNTYSFKGYSITMQPGLLEIAGPKMPGDLVQVSFIDDMVVFIYSDGVVETSTISCITVMQREYLQQLQSTLADRGIMFDAAGGLTYERSQDLVYRLKNNLLQEKKFKLAEAEATEHTKCHQIEEVYRHELQQLDSKRPDLQNKQDELLSKAREDKRRAKNELYIKTDEINEEFYQKILQLESEFSS